MDEGCVLQSISSIQAKMALLVACCIPAVAQAGSTHEGGLGVTLQET